MEQILSWKATGRPFERLDIFACEVLRRRKHRKGRILTRIDITVKDIDHLEKMEHREFQNNDPNDETVYYTDSDEEIEMEKTVDKETRPMVIPLDG